MPQDHTITIKSIKKDDELELSDGGKTEAKKTDKVTWTIAPKSGVKEIVDIKEKPTSNNVFNPDPAPVGNGDWEGTIMNENIKDPIEELYTIRYRKDGDPKVYVYDPIIQMNP